MVKTEIVGATTNKILSAPAGITSSLKTNLRPSAIGCKSPNGPTRLGPIAVLDPGRELTLDPNQVHARGPSTPPSTTTMATIA